MDTGSSSKKAHKSAITSKAESMRKLPRKGRSRALLVIADMKLIIGKDHYLRALNLGPCAVIGILSR